MVGEKIADSLRSLSAHGLSLLGRGMPGSGQTESSVAAHAGLFEEQSYGQHPSSLKSASHIPGVRLCHSSELMKPLSKRSHLTSCVNSSPPDICATMTQTTNVSTNNATTFKTCPPSFFSRVPESFLSISNAHLGQVVCCDDCHSWHFGHLGMFLSASSTESASRRLLRSQLYDGR